jgi:integrase
MNRKVNEENERVKRRYLAWLRNAKRCDEATVDKAAEAILRFERSTDFKSLKRFHIEQAIAFKQRLSKETSAKTGQPLSKATISSVLRAVKGFVIWLADQPGYRSRIRYADAEYFNLNAKDMRIAHAKRPRPFPSLEQCRHAFEQMPDDTPVEKRDKALFAFFMITAARDGAVASLRLKHIDLMEGCVYQDAREVRTKFSKTFTTWFLPIDEVYTEAFAAWVNYLRKNLLFGPEDALFPKPEMIATPGGFEVTGLSREPYANAGLPPYAPHSFRKTLVKWADGYYQTREAFKAFSQNIGHDSVVTTVSAYCPVSLERQAELIAGR